MNSPIYHWRPADSTHLTHDQRLTNDGRLAAQGTDLNQGWIGRSPRRSRQCDVVQSALALPPSFARSSSRQRLRMRRQSLERTSRREPLATGASGPSPDASRHLTIAPTSIPHARTAEHIVRQPSSFGVRTSHDIHPARRTAGIRIASMHSPDTNIADTRIHVSGTRNSGTRNSDTRNSDTRIPDTRILGTRILGTRTLGTPLVHRSSGRSVCPPTLVRSGRGC